jgi:type II secretory ATPase GspE/PulE/Tfp pilus assembly ATPase PilB-like protein
VRIDGILTAVETGIVRGMTSLRVVPGVLEHPELIVLAEQKLLPEERLRELAGEAYGVEFTTVQPLFLSRELIDHYRGSGFIPVALRMQSQYITLATIPEYKGKYPPPYGNYNHEIVLVTPYDYHAAYKKFYGDPGFILPLPALDLFKLVVAEATLKKASDLTIASRPEGIEVYYNINKRKVPSGRRVDEKAAAEIVEFVLGQANAATSYVQKPVIYGSLNLNENHRGRMVVNKTHWGHSLTIRLLSNRLLSQTLEELNLGDEAVSFIRGSVLSLRPGLKLFLGPTMSGKNTTILAALRELKAKNIKIVSVENPVEILTDFVEQINTETEDEYSAAVASLIRQNPDLVYITEMTDRTARDTMYVANTGKSVFSTIHANSVAEVVSRIRDLTDLPLDRIIMSLDCLFYQQLLPRKCSVCGGSGCPGCYKAGMLPVVEYLRFTEDIRRKLLGKSLHEIYLLLTDEMETRTKTNHAARLITEGVIAPEDYKAYMD